MPFGTVHRVTGVILGTLAARPGSQVQAPPPDVSWRNGPGLHVEQSPVAARSGPDSDPISGGGEPQTGVRPHHLMSSPGSRSPRKVGRSLPCPESPCPESPWPNSVARRVLPGPSPATAVLHSEPRGIGLETIFRLSLWAKCGGSRFSGGGTGRCQSRLPGCRPGRTDR
jgi:hypothetical protein